MANNDNLAELVALVGAGNVGALDKFLAPAADTFHTVLKGIAHKRHDVEEKEAACHDAAPSQRLLGGLLALLLNVLDASAGAIVVVVELVERSEIPTEAQSKTLCVRHQVPEACRLFSAAIISWRVREACGPATLLDGVPGERLGRHLNPVSVACHANLIQEGDVTDTLWKTIRRHEALVTALQGNLRVARLHWPLHRVCPAVLSDVMARELLRCRL